MGEVRAEQPMPHDQGLERELCERVCHLLVTDLFEKQAGTLDV
jgi:hypothetical protein